MNAADLIIVLLVLGALGRGVQIGFFRQVLSIAGFFGGLFLGSLLAPKLVGLSSDALIRGLLTFTVPLGLAFLMGAMGEIIGIRLKLVLRKLRFNWLDSLAGGLCGGTAVLIMAWLLAAATTLVPVYGKALAQSKIIDALDQTLPPAPGLIARLESLLNPNSFPRVFVKEPEATPPNVTVSADVQAALARAGNSTVKVQGLGCEAVSSGSGVVVKPGLVATNAHVVAGVEYPTILDSRGRYRAAVIWFDPGLDLALLRAERLNAPALPLYGEIVPGGTASVVLGYPGGGDLKGKPAAVLGTIKAVGRDIYNHGLSTREVYELQARIEQGNSGGPLVLADGSIIGLIFAKSVSTDGVGYALTARQIEPAVARAERQSQPVSTGSCSG